MTGRYRGDIDNLREHILTLRAIVLILVVIIAGLCYSNNRLKDVQRVHIPPDLSTGVTVKLNDVHKPTVYAFAINIFQYLNTWLKDGGEDYVTRTSELAAYITPSYMEWLKSDIDKRLRKGELQGRTRAIKLINGQIFDNNRVDKISAGRFVVWLDFNIDESQSGMIVKTTRIRYAIRVIAADISVEDNPWGLQLDGYEGNPKTISDEDLQ